MDFPILDLMDQEGCCQKLFDLLHPEGFACPRCGARDGLNVHRRHPDSPVVDYRCKALPPGLQHVHRNTLARDPSAARPRSS